MVHRAVLRPLSIAALLALNAAAIGQTTPPAAKPAGAAAPESVLPGRPDAPGGDALDAAFVSQTAGISVRPPAGGKMIRHGGGGGDEIVRFANETDKWTFVVSRVVLTEPVPLTVPNVKPGQTNGFAASVASQMPSDTPGKLIRTDLQPINGYDGALLASRYTEKGAKRFMQQAIIRRTDKSYYVVSLTTALTQDEVETDPAAQKAVDLFAKVVDSVELLDQQKIADDQTDRLIRTRAVMVSWTPDKLHSVLVPEQWLRLMKDGQDIGYTYIVEETAGDLPRAGGKNKGEEKMKDNGVRIGVRSRTVPQNGIAVDAESWMWVQDDRNREIFHNQLVSTEKGKEKDFTYAMDAGMSVRQDRVVPVVVQNPGAVKQNIEASMAPYTLKVVSTSKSQSMPPVDRELPPYYLPQALVHLMPRLLPLGEPRTYLFAAYVPETRQVMLRYVDVQPAKQVTLGGESVTAIPVQERAGLEGSITTHYLSPAGKYMGSVNEDAHITILATDEKTLRQIWKDAKFERPADVDESKK